ncbi:MAG TPA: hypothetical protein VFS50_15495 [Meiothermus sp.]|nr:hypothetical protein [Meiothermus sp.]
MSKAGRKKLAGRWHRLMGSLGIAEEAAWGVLEDLRRRYNEAHRAYHNQSHLETLFSLLDEYEIPERPAVELAVWFHDAVYDPTRTDNEERSALLAQIRLKELGLEGALGERVGELIRATKTHQAADETTAWLLDADLAVLGSEPEVYSAYARAIRLEYAWMPQELYREGRARILMSFLEHPHLYHTEPFRQRFEASARKNLTEELQRLGKQRVR